MGRFTRLSKWAARSEGRLGTRRQNRPGLSCSHRQLRVEALEARTLLSADLPVFASLPAKLNGPLSASHGEKDTSPTPLTPNQVRGA
jgi:hypothetical protein